MLLAFFSEEETPHGSSFAAAAVVGAAAAGGAAAGGAAAATAAAAAAAVLLLQLHHLHNGWDGATQPLQARSLSTRSSYSPVLAVEGKLKWGRSYIKVEMSLRNALWYRLLWKAELQPQMHT